MCALTCIAYIDPGAAGILLQVLIAGFAGAAFYFRRGIARLFSVFRPKKHTPDASDE